MIKHSPEHVKLKYDLRLSPEEVAQKEHAKRYKPGDILSAGEAAAVISENSGKPFSTRNLPHLVYIGRVVPLPEKFSGRYQYPYEAVRDIIIAHRSPGRPMRNDNEVSASALRQRAFKARRRAGSGGAASAVEPGE